MRIAFAAGLLGRRAHYEQLLETAWRDRSQAVLLGGELFPPGEAAEQSAFVEQTLCRLLEQFRRVAPRAAVYYIPGGTDRDDSLDAAEQLEADGLWCAADRQRIELPGGWELLGFSPAPLDPAPVEQLELALLPAPHDPRRTVCLFHCPPHGTHCDIDFAGRHAGSPALRRWIERVQPWLVLCGRVHESPYKSSTSYDRIGQSVICNPGAGELRVHSVTLDLARPRDGVMHSVFGTEFPLSGPEIPLGPDFTL